MQAGARRLMLHFLWTGARCARAFWRASLVFVVLASPVSSEIASARYIDPTNHYKHGILGDEVEYAGMMVRLNNGQKFLVGFSEGGRVFEDIEPRLWDVTGDGLPEIVVIETDPARGAQLAIYGVRNDQVEKIAATPHIGRTHRWLAHLGAADLDGDGKIELAYIDRPHLARVLRIWRFDNGKLVHLSDTPGLTNHRIGQDYISGGIRDCGSMPEIITVNADWSRIIATTFGGKRTKSRGIGPFKGRDHLAKSVRDCPD